MSDIPNIVTPLLWALAITTPLGLWEAVEIIIWLASHITVTLS